MIQKMIDCFKVTFHNYRKDFEKNEREIEKMTAYMSQQKRKYKTEIESLNKENEKLKNKIESFKIYEKIQETDYTKLKDDYRQMHDYFKNRTNKLQTKLKKSNGAKGGLIKQINLLNNKINDLNEIINSKDQQLKKINNKLNIKRFANCENNENYHKTKINN